MVDFNQGLNREERVLALLYLLGEEVSEQVMKELGQDEAITLQRRLPEFAENPPSIRQQREVLDEFSRCVQLLKQTTARPALGVVHPDVASSDGGESQVEGSPESTNRDVFEDLNHLTLFQLSKALEDELPRTVALLLKTLESEKIAELLQLIPEPRKELIVKEFSTDPKIPELMLRRLAIVTVEKGRKFQSANDPKGDPVSRLVQVLRATEKSKRKEILKAIEAQNPEQAALISQNLYQFEDILSLENSQIQKVLTKVDATTLATALANTSDDLKEKILQNLSKRARGSLQEEMGFRTGVSSSQLKASRMLVAAAIAEVEQESE